MAELKAKAFRADEETIAMLDTWAKERGLRNSDILPALVSAAKLSEQKMALAGRADEIDNFGSLLRQLETAYLASLDLARNANDRARSEFVAKLESQQSTIESLQQAAQASENRATAAQEAADANKKSREAAEERMAADAKHVEELTAAMQDKDALIKALTEQKADLVAQLADAKAVIRKTEEAVEQAKREVEGRYAAKYEVEVQRIRNEADRSIMDVRQQTADKIDALHEKLDALRTENSALRERKTEHQNGGS